VPTQTEQHSTSFSRTRTVAITELRRGFTIYGFDVGAYADDQVSGAIVAVATADTDSSRDLFTRAFERLQNR
jgi:ABC-type arginine transport system permease subunit